MRAPRLRTFRTTMRLGGCAVIGACLAAPSVAPANAYVKSSITVDARTGAVLQSKNADASHSPASLSKMMTLYLVFEAISRGRLYWNSMVTISRHAATRSPVKLHLRAGQRVRVRDLVYATAVKSANDAATALGEKIAGSDGRFARLMTLRARQLGMRRTVFETASGLPSYGQRTTARDMAILARALIRHYPRYHRVFATRYYRFGRRAFRNTNRLLHSHPNVDGMKTGYTNRARYNLVTSARSGRTRVITVVLGASSSNARYRTASLLLASAWRKARSVMYTRGHYKRRIQVVARSRVGGGLSRKKPTRHAVVATNRKPAIIRNTAMASTKKIVSKSALTGHRSPKKKIRLTLASSASAISRPPASVRYVWERKRVVRYIRKRVVRWQSTHGVQVGAYYSRWRAQAALRRALKILPRSYRRLARTTIDRKRHRRRSVYVSRLMGYRASQARRACYSLRRRGVGCVPIYGRIAVASYVKQRKVVTIRVRKTVPVVLKKEPVIIAKATKPKPKPETRKQIASTDTRSDTPRYAIQVGAFTEYRWAKRGLNRAQKALSSKIARGKGTRIFARGNDSAKPIYRARITGMSRDEAKEACNILKKQSLRCLAVRTQANG